MIDVRIICTHDAAKLAETLTRLLEAEEHRVHLTIGRQALGELEAARQAKDAVLLIWSPDARSQTYMREWASKIEPARVIDLTLMEDWPRLGRKALAIDFSQWRGERSNRNPAWRSLTERLVGVARALNPPKPPPKYAPLALGLVSCAALASAVVLRINDHEMLRNDSNTQQDQLVAADPSTGLGGPVSAVEPASVLDSTMMPVRNFPDAPLMREATSTLQMTSLPTLHTYELRDPTIMERISAFNPLRSNERDANDGQR